MDKGLKQGNKLALATVFVANLVFYYFVYKFGFDFNQLKVFTSVVKEWSPILLVSILVGVINSQLSADLKARLVFWKWKHPLPGCRAFTELVGHDARIDLSALKKGYGEFPNDPLEQNRLWYKWYCELQEEPAVRQAHKEFLFYRDYTVLSLVLVLFLGGLSIWQYDFMTRIVGYMMIMIGQYFLVRNAAVKNGERFVCTVIAIKSTPSNKKDVK